MSIRHLGEKQARCLFYGDKIYYDSIEARCRKIEKMTSSIE
ncbi:hypothetical protein ACN4EE_14325 [Geminocystis sp. CENA526]